MDKSVIEIPNDTLLDTFRGHLPSTVAIWTHRRDTDIYQHKRKSHIRGDIERDHIIEVQCLDWSLNAIPVASRTRSGLASVKIAYNSLLNLNNTTKTINQKKKGPFTRWLHKANNVSSINFVGEPVRDIARRNCYELVDNGTWDNIQTAIVQSYDEYKSQELEVQNKRSVELFDETLNKMLENMGIFDT